MSEYRAKFVYSAPVARRAYVSYLWERCAALLVLSPVLLGWSIANWDSREYGQLAGVGVGVVLVLWAAWLGGLRHAARVADASGSPEVELIATEDRCLFRMPQAESAVNWSGIAALYRLRKFWIFVRTGMVNPSFVPIEALDPEARAFVERKVREAGGRVR